MITEFKLKSGFFVYFQSQVDGKTKSLLNLLDLESSLFSDDEDELRVLDRDEDEIEVATHSKVIQSTQPKFNLQSSVASSISILKKPVQN